MSEYAIRTSHLTKKYGEQKSVDDLCLHVKKRNAIGGDYV